MATQRIAKIRRDYNAWVANETLEDYALRFAPRSFRRWSPFWVSNTAFGAVSFLALEAIGGALVVNHGFINACAAIIAVSIIIFLLSLPIAYYSAKHNIDIDLLTRGGGFGYLGSTFTSLIYASFTFIFFAIEAAIMSLALEMYFGVPLPIGYIVSSIIIIPMVLYGITAIGVMQAVTQPLWLVLMILPYIFVAIKHPDFFREWTTFAGRSESGNHFDPVLFGAAATVVFSLVAQIGEQVDYLRFLPPKTPQNRVRWWTALLVAGPGWILLGMVKQLGGAFLAFLALQHELTLDRAVEPTRMYLVAYQYVFDDIGVAAAFATAFVLLSQIKINITNAYAGSLAWSNFFSRLTHSHPGRVVWLVFNVIIALLLMELGVFAALENVLGMYANFATAWIGALVADLVINKPLGLSPAHIEFKRSHLFDINPVGLGGTVIASSISIAAYLGVFGETAQSFSTFIALLAAFVTVPLLAFVTKGRYFLAREDQAPAGITRCVVCDNRFEHEDIAHCPAYEGAICSLCCTLDARCHDLCKESADESPGGAFREFCLSFGQWANKRLRHRTWRFILIYVVVAAVLGVVLNMVYQQSLHAQPQQAEYLQTLFLKLYAILLLLSGMGVWWLVLNAESRRVVEGELNKHNALLMKEADEHQKTDAKLQKAKEDAEMASLAKSRFLTDMSHELRSPLNSIMGYAQLLRADPNLPTDKRNSAGIILESGEHILSIIEDILDIARIEARRLNLVKNEFDLAGFLHKLVSMFKPQAKAKGIEFRLQLSGELPGVVKGDERRIRQVLINLIGNAVKYTQVGEVTLQVSFAREIVHFAIKDTGPGISETDLDNLFRPFFRGQNARNGSIEGAGLGLTISKLLMDIMGGELTVESRLYQGTTFAMRMFLPEVTKAQAVSFQSDSRTVINYNGPRRTILITDDEEKHRVLLRNILSQIGFRIIEAQNGEDCVRIALEQQPDLVLMDLLMPGTSGSEATQALREKEFRGPIIALTANVLEENREQFTRAGADDFITKPVNIDELYKRLRIHLGLDWIYASSENQEEPARTLLFPDREVLEKMREYSSLGHVKAVQQLLDGLEHDGDSRYREFVRVAKGFTKNFRLQELADFIGS